MSFASFAPIIGAGIQAGSSLFGGAIGAAGQQATNAQQFAQNEMMFSQQQTAQQHFLDQQQGYNTLMSNTAYQRSMEDMKLAGLNPILAAGGNVTNIGSGGSASVSPVGSGPLGNPGSAMQAGLTSAGQAASTAAAIKTALASADQAESQKDLNKATETLAGKQASKTDQDTETSKSAARLNDAAAATKVLEGYNQAAQASSASALARVNTRVAEDTEKWGDSPISKAIGGIVRMLSTVGGTTPGAAVSSARDLVKQAPSAATINPSNSDLLGTSQKIQDRIRRRRAGDPYAQ